MAKTILLVDDDVILVEMYNERLKMEGFNVLIAKNGDEGLKLAKEKKPDLILLDIMMPKINGLDVLRELKADSATKGIPVLLLTALIQESDRVKGLTEGADDYIVKSETMPAEVMEKIKKNLK